jgi:transposase-like protein
MSETEIRRPRRRRSRAEAEQLLVEFETSGMTCVEFCQQHGLAPSSLARYQRRRQQEQKGGSAAGRWLAVELSPPGDTASGLAVVLASRRRIEVGRGFDARTLEQLVGLLERA